MRPSIRLALAVAVLVAGCSSAEDADDDRFAGACRLQPCVCVDDLWDPWPTFRTAAVQWLPGGVPSCPAGYALRPQRPPQRLP